MSEVTTVECFGCKFFRKSLIAGDNDGECRRYPPTANPDTESVIFPQVYPYDWCGEFKPKEEK